MEIILYLECIHFCCQQGKGRVLVVLVGVQVVVLLGAYCHGCVFVFLFVILSSF